MALQELAEQLISASKRTKDLENSLKECEEIVEETKLEDWRKRLIIMLNDIRKEVQKAEAKEIEAQEKNTVLKNEISVFKKEIEALTNDIKRRQKNPILSEQKEEKSNSKIDDETKHAAKAVRNKVAENGKKQNVPGFTEFTPIRATKQNDSKGVHFTILVRTNKDKYIKCGVLRKPDKTFELTDFSFNVQKNDKLNIDKKLGGTKPAQIDDMIKLAVSKVEEAFKNQAKHHNIHVKKYEIMEAMKQVVAGVNYFVKVKIGDGNCAFLKIWGKLDKTFELTDVKFGTEKDKLAYF